MTSSGRPCSAIAAAYCSSVIGTNVDLAARGAGDLADRLGERQQARAGQLVDLAGVPVLGQRRDRDVGDVLDVDERLAHAVDRQRELALEHAARGSGPR